MPLIRLFLIATLVNYCWEIMQAPLFGGMDDLRVVLWHCFPSAVGDAVLVLLILALGALALRRRDWYRKPGVAGYALMLGAGLVIGVTVEWIGHHALQRWSYAPVMPVLPVVNVGLVPIAQMLLLPPLIFWIARRWPVRTPF